MLLFFTLVFTGIAAVATRQTVKAMQLTAGHILKVERAYVGLSHEEPGLNPDNRKVAVQVQNTGETPAKVVGVRLGIAVVEKDGDLPSVPPSMEDHPSAQAFLQAGDRFTVRQGLPISDADWGDITRGAKTLYVVGLVEYIDVFDVWHRAGYARRYAHGRLKNNLTFAPGDAYSYDIEIAESNRLIGT